MNSFSTVQKAVANLPASRILMNDAAPRRVNWPVHRLFLRCAALLIWLVIPVAHTHAQTQAAMNAQAGAEFQRADADLNRTYQAVLTKLPTVESKQKLREAQRAWVASRDAEAAGAAKETEGGSIAPTLRYQTMTNLTRKRITELKAVVDKGSPTAGQTNPISPDGRWEYRCVGGGDCLPEIVKAGTSERAGNLSEIADRAEVIWAPDSKRVAFNYNMPLTHHHYDTVAFYQLHGDEWRALPEFDPAYPQRCDADHANWRLRNWTAFDTAVIYASCPGKRDSAFQLTLKFDDAGNWKIVKTRRMSEKEVEK